MNNVCRVEGKAGLVLRENLNEFQIQEQALIVMGKRRAA